MCVKRFLARFGYAHLLARHDDEQRLRAAVRIQVQQSSCLACRSDFARCEAGV